MFSVAIVATLSLWGSWASAESAYSDDFDQDDAAFVAEVDAEQAEADDLAFIRIRAESQVEAAPAYCAVTYVARDASRGYVAVCDLVGDGSGQIGEVW